MKKYNFYYWFAFPASIDPVLHENLPSNLISNIFSAKEVSQLNENYNNLTDQRLAAFFICNASFDIQFLKDVLKHDDPFINLNDANLDSTYFCFSDPSEYDNPGWPLRNFILMLLKLCPILIGKQIKVISIRLDERRTLSPSIMFTIDLQNAESVMKDDVKWTGWERNNQGKLLPKAALMGDSMDPVKLSDHFSSLNLKLMKWRLLPNLDLDAIKAQKCLLFGAGTLGCAIARNLLSWGVNDITFIDYGNVGFSNPVRQYLFTHDDAIHHKAKATTAADRLKEILPSINATGYVLQVPMPGHSISDSMRPKTIENLKLITSLIQDHDVLFLVTDSRESRWLPTLLGAFFRKVSSLTDKIIIKVEFIAKALFLFLSILGCNYFSPGI